MALPTGLWQKHFGEDNPGVVGLMHPNFCSFMDELAAHDLQLIEAEKAAKAAADTIAVMRKKVKKEEGSSLAAGGAGGKLNVLNDTQLNYRIDMKTTQRFDRAISALIKSYLNNTLVPGQCSSCAVGNMIADSCGYRVLTFEDMWIVEDHDKGDMRPVQRQWQHVFFTGNTQTMYPQNYKGEAKRQLDSTGYSWLELARIEYAFEKATPKKFSPRFSDPKIIDTIQYAGLCAVFDVLCEIEGIADASEYKAMLAKPCAV